MHKTYMECDWCGDEIFKEAMKDSLIFKTSVGSLQSPYYQHMREIEFHMCNKCREKHNIQKIDTSSPQYEKTVFNLLSDLLVEMGVVFDKDI